MEPVNVRYIVDDVDRAVEFYTALGFEVVMRPGPGFAMLQRGALRLLVNVPGGGGGAGEAVDGQRPAPGGWNRFQLEVPDLAATMTRLHARGAHFRGDRIRGRGGSQALLEDPAGNLIELFEPAPAP